MPNPKFTGTDAISTFCRLVAQARATRIRSAATNEGSERISALRGADMDIKEKPAVVAAGNTSPQLEEIDART